ncbi:ferritin-like domain-containing protein [Brevibacillus daliensis]|uniref:ferritin-like domain-containing protein n=1 Tax=Brevibacillus daliensis TaxID=2892995 RepID=UPI001E3B30DE|nr:ferritin-like domain-containing protein [Brevibacillus daliensis]
MYPHFYPAYGVVPVYNIGPSEFNLIIPILEESIADEREDELFYDSLIALAPTQLEKEVITSIRNDERKHRRYLRQIYKELTGRDAPPGKANSFQPPASYLEGLEKALLGELQAFERYRTVYMNIPERYKNMIFEIMTDELKHAGYYNWLYAKNK